MLCLTLKSVLERGPRKLLECRSSSAQLGPHVAEIAQIRPNLGRHRAKRGRRRSHLHQVGHTLPTISTIIGHCGPESASIPPLRPTSVRARPSSARLGSERTKLAPTSTNFSRTSATICSDSTRPPNVSGIRPSFARTCRKSINTGPNTTKLGPSSTKSGPISADFDQRWSGIHLHWPGIGFDPIWPDFGQLWLVEEVERYLPWNAY